MIASCTISLICLFLAIYVFSIAPRISKKKEMAAFLDTMFAHRGYHCAERLIPENSMEAFRAAVARGYAIELDVHLTRDQKIAVFHDDTLARLLHAPGSIEDYSFDELSKFHLLNTAERIPLLGEVLSYVDGRVPLLIELKIPGSSLDICGAVYRELQSYRGAYLIQSFHPLALRWFRQNAPSILRGQLSSNLSVKDSGRSWITCFLLKNLLLNFLSRPDFLSYKLSDLPNPSVSLCRVLFQTPVAVWTLRTEEALKQGKRHYPIWIFEKNRENYE